MGEGTRENQSKTDTVDTIHNIQNERDLTDDCSSERMHMKIDVSGIREELDIDFHKQDILR